MNCNQCKCSFVCLRCVSTSKLTTTNNQHSTGQGSLLPHHHACTVCRLCLSAQQRFYVRFVCCFIFDSYQRFDSFSFDSFDFFVSYKSDNICKTALGTLFGGIFAIVITVVGVWPAFVIGVRSACRRRCLLVFVSFKNRFVLFVCAAHESQATCGNRCQALQDRSRRRVQRSDGMVRPILSLFLKSFTPIIQTNVV